MYSVIKIFGIVIIGVLVLVGCNTNTKKENGVIKVPAEELYSPEYKRKQYPYLFNIEKSIKNIKDVKLSDIVKKIEYIPLETSKECLLSGNLKLLFHNKSIFIKDKKALYEFDNSGNFKRKIGKNGNGPGEYGMVFGFTVSPEHSELLLVAYPSKKILVYDLESGKYKRSFGVNFSDFINIIRFPENQLTFHIGIATSKDDKNNKNNLYFTDKLGTSIDSIPSTIVKEKGNFNGDLVTMYTSGNSLRYMTFLTDTLYEVSEKIVRNPYAIFNMGKFKTDPEINLTMKLIEANNHNLLPTRLEETHSNFFITFIKGFKSEHALYGVFDKKKNELNFITYGNNGIENNLDEVLPSGLYMLLATACW